jgi:hypothetical protein
MIEIVFVIWFCFVLFLSLLNCLLLSYFIFICFNNSLIPSKRSWNGNGNELPTRSVREWCEMKAFDNKKNSSRTLWLVLTYLRYSKYIFITKKFMWQLDFFSPSLIITFPFFFIYFTTIQSTKNTQLWYFVWKKNENIFKSTFSFFIFMFYFPK